MGYIRIAKSTVRYVGKSDCLKGVKNIKKAVHYNGDTVALFWYGDIGTLKNVAIFGTRYYAIDAAPALVRKYMEVK
jgi:hypothetical protein